VGGGDSCDGQDQRANSDNKGAVLPSDRSGCVYDRDPAVLCHALMWVRPALAGGYTHPELSMRDPRQGPGRDLRDPATYDVNGISANPRLQKNAAGSRMPGSPFA